MMGSTIIDKLVTRFLSWKLPKDFNPDGGVKFYGTYEYTSPYWPVGTNLFTAIQAREMLIHVLGEKFITDARAESEEEGDAYTRGWFDGSNDRNDEIESLRARVTELEEANRILIRML